MRGDPLRFYFNPWECHRSHFSFATVGGNVSQLRHLERVLLPSEQLWVLRDLLAGTIAVVRRGIILINQYSVMTVFTCQGL